MYNTKSTKTMEDKTSPTTSTLHDQLTAQYGILLSQTQLAELLGRTVNGLRFSFSIPADDMTRRLKACGRKIGRRVYYPAVEVARIIGGSKST